MDEQEFVQNSKYSIFAIIVHWGKSIQAGHYISIIKRNQKWYYCDDDEIKEINENKILFENAYLLFYRKNNN